MPLEPGSEDWQRIAKAFFKAPSPAADEAFVARVMGRIEAEEGRTEPLGWLKPALSLAFAAATAVMAFSWTMNPEAQASGELLSMASAGLLYAQTPVSADELLGVSLEDR